MSTKRNVMKSVMKAVFLSHSFALHHFNFVRFIGFKFLSTLSPHFDHISKVIVSHYYTLKTDEIEAFAPLQCIYLPLLIS